MLSPWLPVYCGSRIVPVFCSMNPSAVIKSLEQLGVGRGRASGREKSVVNGYQQLCDLGDSRADNQFRPVWPSDCFCSKLERWLVKTMLDLPAASFECFEETGELEVLFGSAMDSMLIVAAPSIGQRTILPLRFNTKF
nr:hypothetical protein Iba_chr06aCG16590 [Ipomoea batatas]